MDIILRPIIPASIMVLATNLSGGFSRRVFNAINRVGKRAQTAFNEAVANWDPPPYISYIGDASIGEIEVWCDDKRLLWVDDGVRPHVEYAHGRAMVFQASYQAKSKPNRILRGSGSYGGSIVFARRVNHPGIKPRNISKRIAEQTQRNLNREVLAAIKP